MRYVVRVLNVLGPVVMVAAAIAFTILPYWVISGRLDRHDREVLELQERRLELSRRLHDREEFDRINWPEQNRINELNYKMHGQGFQRWDQLSTRVGELEKVTNIPPQQLPVTPKEPVDAPQLQRD